MASQRSDRSGDEIEFLPPDDRVFGPADDRTFAGVDDGTWPDDPDDEHDSTPRSRWATALAGLGVAGILAVGVVVAAPWADDPAATPGTTVAPTTLVAAPGSAGAGVALDPAATGWILDPVPEGLEPNGFLRAEQFFVDRNGWGEVWASPGASRTSGRWFSLTLLPFRSFQQLRSAQPSGFPVDVAGQEGFADIDGDSVVTLSYDAGVSDADRLVTIVAFGFTIPELVELADSIGIVDDRPQMVDDRPEFLRPELLVGLEQLAAERTDRDLTSGTAFGGRLASLAFYNGPGPSGITLVQEQEVDLVSDAALLDLAWDRIDLVREGWSLPPGFDDAGVAAGRWSLSGDDVVIVRWMVDGRALSLLTTGDVDDALAVLPSVRLATAEEWAELERSGDGFSSPVERTPPALTLRQEMLPDGREFTALHWPNTAEIELRVGDGSVLVPLGTSPWRVLTLDDVTVVVGVTTDASSTMRVTTEAGVTTVPSVEITAATNGTPRTSYVAVTPLLDLLALGAFAAEIVAPTGEVLARLAPWGGA